MESTVCLNRSVKCPSIDLIPFRWVLPEGVQKDLMEAVREHFGLEPEEVEEVFTLVNPPHEVYLYTTVWCGDTWVNIKIRLHVEEETAFFRSAEMRYIPGRRTFESAGLAVSLGESEDEDV